MADDDKGMHEIAAGVLLRNARVLADAALAAAELVPHVTMAQQPHLDTVREYLREIITMLDTVTLYADRPQGGA